MPEIAYEPEGRGTKVKFSCPIRGSAHSGPKKGRRSSLGVACSAGERERETIGIVLFTMLCMAKSNAYFLNYPGRKERRKVAWLYEG